MFNTKKSFFKEKVRDVTKAIWELEFKIAKARQLREEIRADRGHALERVNVLDTMIEGSKDEAQKKEMTEQKETLIDNAKRYESQMAMIDKQINGDSESKEPSHIETLKAMTELREMYKAYIKTL